MIKNCPMRHENGNCIPAGGFCTANKNICEALLNAYRMGKEQLSKEGTTKDAINRQQALDAVGKYASVWMEYTDAMSKDEIAQIALNNAKSAMIRILKELPPAQPEPHEGHWIGSDGSYICSECNGSPIDFIETMGDSFDAYMETPMPYCPNCGVKMTISK